MFLGNVISAIHYRLLSPVSVLLFILTMKTPSLDCISRTGALQCNICDGRLFQTHCSCLSDSSLSSLMIFDLLFVFVYWLHISPFTVLCFFYETDSFMVPRVIAVALTKFTVPLCFMTVILLLLPLAYLGPWCCVLPHQGTQQGGCHSSLTLNYL